MKSNAHQTDKRSLRWVIGMILLLLGSTASAQKTLSDGVKDLATQLSASITKEQKQRVAVPPFKELGGQTTVQRSWHVPRGGAAFAPRQLTPPCPPVTPTVGAAIGAILAVTQLKHDLHVPRDRASAAL